MNASPRQYAEALFVALKEVTANDAKKIIDKFVELLVLNNKASLVEKILFQFDQIWKKEFSLISAEICVGHKVDEKTLEIIKKKLAQLSNSKNLFFELKERPDLIGGFTARYDDMFFDASIKSKIDSLQNFLLNA